jgi:hypothetical protein
LCRCYSSGNCGVNPTGNGKLETGAIEPFEHAASIPCCLVLVAYCCFVLFYFIYFFNLGQSRIDSHKHNVGGGGRTRPAFPPPHVSECNLNRECLDVGSSLESHSPTKRMGIRIYILYFFSVKFQLSSKKAGGIDVCNLVLQAPCR